MLRSHSDAIRELERAGIRAERRDWVLGDTIVVPLGRPSTASGIELYPNVAWLVPRTSPRWELVQPVVSIERVREFESLDAACNAAIETARLFVLTDRCERCGSDAELDFRESAGDTQFQWWVSTRCASCGARSESDGAGPLPDSLREIELRRNGTWTATASPPSSAVAWSALRTALALDLAGLAALKARLPAAIFTGTFCEASRLRHRLLRDNIESEVAETG
jgi:hypothetical protein